MLSRMTYVRRPDRLAVLDAIKAADLKVVRLFISETFENFKGTGSIYMPDVEPKQVRVYNDTQLEAIDQLMVEAHERDIKLTIAMHDRYQLGCWGNDTYVTKYNLPALDCAVGKARDNDVARWYGDAAPIADFENRVKHILEHRNTLIDGSPAWKDLSSHIFSFNIQNEGQGHLNGNIAPHPEWWCDRATFMRGIMGASKVLISTGGGNEFPNSDVPQNWACPALDIVNLHSYSGVEEFRTKGAVALQHALEAGKLTLFEEFGATGKTSQTKPDQIADHIRVFNDLGVPWMPWQISKPGNGEADFEFWTDEKTYNVVKEGSEEAQRLRAAQAWPL
ncbi:mannan endo-1,4-beta-mannosidase [Microdochium nivale]|nr:mannan endo-1,4-beta-mannosidase [Microdochium nivale]